MVATSMTSQDILNIRNFSIIAHIDHGKSTLADRMLECTHTVSKRLMVNQFLDSMELERERGITIKLKAVKMIYVSNDISYILNLIDTPGHVDFSYEVSRSLVACEGAILLVDATQGVQAQTVAVVDKAFSYGLKVIPVVNKIDLPYAMVEQTALDIVKTFGFKQNEILFSSGKSGEGIDKILQKIVEVIPPPQGDLKKPFRALIFDSSFDEHLGVLASVRVVDGSLAVNEKIKFFKTNQSSSALKVGVMAPNFCDYSPLSAGEVGILATGLKDIKQVRVGDTVSKQGISTEPLLGYNEPKPVVFLGLYPLNSSRFLDLRKALERLSLNDASLSYEPESGGALGHGFKCGFLGLLHAEIIQERIEREFNLEVVSTTPTVAYKVSLTDGVAIFCSSASFFPDPSKIDFIEEPVCELTIYVPSQYMGKVIDLCSQKRATILENNFVGNVELQRVKLKFIMPLAEMITDFYDRLKSISSGYASLDYEIVGYAKVDAVKLSILVAETAVDALSRIAYRGKALDLGRQIITALKETLPKEQFPVALQAAIGGAIIARETIPAMRKTVTQKLYGGDVTRKNKLLDRQKEGKARLKQMGLGRVQITKKAFWKVVKIG
ncbi:MAG: translation elongation factor 4 [Patescibacteria group bacterium]